MSGGPPDPSPLMGLAPLFGSSGGRTCNANGWVGVNVSIRASGSRRFVPPILPVEGRG